MPWRELKWHPTLSMAFLHMHRAFAANCCSECRRESAGLSDKRVHVLSTLDSELDIHTCEGKRKVLDALDTFLVHGKEIFLCHQQFRFGFRLGSG